MLSAFAPCLRLDCALSASTLWVLSGDGKSIVAKDCTFVHGLYQTFDEILVNAADNVHRNKGALSLLSWPPAGLLGPALAFALGLDDRCGACQAAPR